MKSSHELTESSIKEESIDNEVEQQDEENESVDGNNNSKSRKRKSAASNSVKTKNSKDKSKKSKSTIITKKQKSESAVNTVTDGDGILIKKASGYNKLLQLSAGLAGVLGKDKESRPQVR